MKLRRSGILMKIVILALLICAGVSLHDAKSRVAAAEADLAALQAQADAAVRENAELAYAIAHAGDPERIASAARSGLGLVMPGEKIFFDISN